MIWVLVACADAALFVAGLFGHRGCHWEKFTACDFVGHAGYNVWIAGTLAT